MKTAQAATPRPDPRDKPSPVPRATLSRKTPATTPKRRPKAAPNAIQIPRFPQIPRPAAPGGVLLLVIASLPTTWAERLTIWRPTTADTQPTSSTKYHLTSRFPPPLTAASRRRSRGRRILVEESVTAPAPPERQARRPSNNPRLIRLTAYEICRLLVLIQPQPPHTERLRHGLAWSQWRRRHHGAGIEW